MKKLIIILLSFTFLSSESYTQDIETFTNGFTKKEGFINYYWDDSKGKLYLEISKLEEELLYVNYLSAGVGSNDIGLDRGQIGGSRIIKFVKMGPKVFMVQPNYTFRAISNNSEEVKSIEDAFAKSTLWGFSVVAQSGSRYLLDLSLIHI